MTSQTNSHLAATVARNIRTARDSAALTQRALAEQVGVDSMVISKWERANHRPSHENMIRLAEALDRSVAWFYTEHRAAA